VTNLLEDAEIARRIAEAENRPLNRFIKPLSEVGESLIDALRVEDGIALGLTQIDVLTRGFRPSDLVILTGFAHSGKTQIVNQMLVENPTKRIVFFSLDDPAEMILAKLVAMVKGVGSERIEDRVRDGDEGTVRMIMEVAEKWFPNLFVVDEVIGIPSMLQAVAEAEKIWGAPPNAVILDYVEMMPGDGVSDDHGAQVKRKINALKTWAKQAEYPVIALHQGTRSGAKPGEPITLLSMGFSGEQQATLVLGVRRKKDDAGLEEYERQQHEHTITVHLVKNKRPGGRVTHFNGVDYHLDPTTGVIGQLRDPRETSTADILRERQQHASNGYQRDAEDRLADQLGGVEL